MLSFKSCDLSLLFSRKRFLFMKISSLIFVKLATIFIIKKSLAIKVGIPLFLDFLEDLLCLEVRLGLRDALVPGGFR